MAKPLQKERENRSADKKDLTFHSYDITPETAHTAVLLLESKEPELLCQTLRAITKYSAQDLANRIVLFNLDAIKYISLHIDHPETNIKRFACKALAQMSELPRGPEQIVMDPENLRRIAFLLAKCEDIFVLEFTSFLLSELTREPHGCEQLISANILSVLLNRMKNIYDPDVQKNCLQTVSNVLADPVCSAEMTKNPQFQWPPLLALMQSKYVAIQSLALKTVEQLVSRYKDVTVQKTFQASTGVTDLCDILESYEFRDVHILVLGVLKSYVETEENALHVYQTGCVDRLLAYLEMALPDKKPYCIAVLCKMTYSANGRMALFETGTDLVFCHHLLSSNNDLLADAAQGVANMTLLYWSAVRMADTNIIEALAGIVGDETMEWFNIRYNALLAVSKLVRLVPRAAAMLVEPKAFGTLRAVSKKGSAAPVEGQRLVLQCFVNLLPHHTSLKAMQNADFVSDMINCMTRIDVQLKILASNVLTGLTAEEAVKHIFNSRKGEAVVSANLAIEHVGLRTALCLLIAASVTEDGADAYLALGTILYMVENKQARYVVSAWEPALEAIFGQHPSAKLAYTGRLEVNDFTTEGFYVVKRLGDTFPTMQEIMSSPPPHVNPVFITMFFGSANSNRSSIDIRAPHASEARVSKSASSRLRLARVPDDVGLREYMLRLRIWFGDPTKSLHYVEVENAFYEVRYREKCTEVSSTLKHRARVLGEFVADQMSGLTQERNCSLPSVDIALNDLMLELKSRVIGIGWVKCGGQLERAILYKVLADRIGLPCALFRASSAHAWCEVAVPEPDPEDDPDFIDKYPAGLLRANYVVDLMDYPGRLIPRSSHEAVRVCGPQCAPLYVARCVPAACRCDPRDRDRDDPEPSPVV